MADRLRNLLYPLTIIMIVASLWAYAEAESLRAQINPNWMPPIDPELTQRVWGVAHSADTNPVETVAVIPVEP